MIALTRRAALVIGGDTGPVHLAAALGRPTVALFGPTDPDRNGPAFVGARVTVLRDAASVTSHKRTTETEAGLARIRVEEVLAAALAMLEGE
jgi:heptosyltransferase-1